MGNRSQALSMNCFFFFLSIYIKAELQNRDSSTLMHPQYLFIYTDLKLPLC